MVSTSLNFKNLDTSASKNSFGISRLGISSYQIEKLGLVPKKGDRLKETQRKLKRASEFRGALDVLFSSKITFWVLKGIEISFRNYGDPLARTFGDLDILVPNKELIGELRKYLLSKGWQDQFEDEWIEDLPRRDWYMDRRHHISMIDPIHGVSVELHWQLDYRFLKLPEKNLELILEKETGTIEILNRKINVLSPELEYVFLLAHGARHAWCSFKWLVDVYHFPMDKIDSAKLEYWLDYFQIHKLLFLYQALATRYFKEKFQKSQSVPRYLVDYCFFRLENKELRLPMSIANTWDSFYFDLLLVRNYNDLFKVIDLLIVRATDIFQVKLPFQFLYYFYRPIGILRRSIGKGNSF